MLTSNASTTIYKIRISLRLHEVDELDKVNEVDEVDEGRNEATNHGIAVPPSERSSAL